MNPELAARRTAAAAVLADYKAAVDSAPLHKPVGREWTLALALALALSGLLAASGELTEAQDANARMVSEVRAVLADPGRVADDRQYALEQIESIVLAGGAS